MMCSFHRLDKSVDGRFSGALSLLLRVELFLLLNELCLVCFGFCFVSFHGVGKLLIKSNQQALLEFLLGLAHGGHDR